MNIKKDMIRLGTLNPNTVSAFWGMDISAYPGDAKMQNWWDYSTFRYTGFYLAPAPNHNDTSWMKSRSTLVNQGWGFLPIYVGRQSESNSLTKAQGIKDAQNASTLARQAGFPESTYIYLDIELGGTLSSAFIAYISSWLNEIKTNTPYKPAVYCSYSKTSDQIKSMAPASTRFWVFNISSYSGNPAMDLAPKPDRSGVSYAAAWQLCQNKPIAFGSYTLNIDISASSLTDPSL